jgi:aldehyde:ferredoxin oxidoreductase
MYGYAGKYAVVDLSTGQVSIHPLDEKLIANYVGARGFIVRWLYDLMPPGADPLGPDNPLIFAVGPMTGTLAPSSGRWTVGAKAPQTGFISVGIGGGQWGAHFKWTGFDALIITGQSPTPVYLLIQDEKIHILPADDLWGKDNTETEASIRQKHGNADIQVASIGPGGENLNHVATIIANRVRSAGRGGVGAVMGSKRLKAVAVHGTQGVPVYDPRGLIQETHRMTARLMEERHYETYSTWGTTKFLDRYTEAGGLMTYNAQKGIFPHWRDIDGRVYISEHRHGQAACFACPIPCSSYFGVKSTPKLPGVFGEAVSASTLKEPGARCGVKDMGMILRAHIALDRYGLDLISTPATIAFAMEAYEKEILSHRDTGGSALNFGDGNAVLEFIRRTAYREGLGDALGQGSRACSRLWGKGSDYFRSDSKGLEPPATDPRAYPSWALGYATSSRGACHMRAYSVCEFGGVNEEQADRIGVDLEVNERLAWQGKARAVAFFEDLRAMGDSLTNCRFVARNELAFPEWQVGILNAVTGRNFTVVGLYLVGERISNLERLFNLREGLTPEDDTLPKRYLEEPLTEGASAGCVVPLEEMLVEYYEARDWDRGTGYPSEAKLKQLGLDKDVKPQAS